MAVRNTAFVEGEELLQPIKITKPGRIFSMDETRLTNDATTCSKAKANRSVIGKDGDCGEVIVNKGGGNGTGIGDTSADGLDLPGFFIFANNIIHAGENDEDVGSAQLSRLSARPDPNDASKPMLCRFWTNATGGRHGRPRHPLHSRVRGAVPPRLVPGKPGLAHHGWARIALILRWSYCSTAGRTGCTSFCARHTQPTCCRARMYSTSASSSRCTCKRSTRSCLRGSPMARAA